MCVTVSVAVGRGCVRLACRPALGKDAPGVWGVGVWGAPGRPGAYLNLLMFFSDTRMKSTMG